MRPLRYSINVTLDGCCDHRVMFTDEDLHRPIRPPAVAWPRGTEYANVRKRVNNALKLTGALECRGLGGFPRRARSLTLYRSVA